MNPACVIDEVVPAGEPWMGVVRRGREAALTRALLGVL